MARWRRRTQLFNQFDIDNDYHFLTDHARHGSYAKVRLIDFCGCRSAHVRVSHGVFHRRARAIYIQRHFPCNTVYGPPK